MKEITDIHEIQKIGFDILCDVDKFCHEHGIRYFLCGGTLLGAIRHKGFIPWDDDIDIGMLRPDYNRFLKEYTSPDNTLVWHGNDSTCFYPFAKLFNANTLLLDNDFQNHRIGVYIDVFPFDEVDDNPRIWNRSVRRMEWINKIHALRNIRLFRRGRPLLNQLIVFLRAPLRLFPNRMLLAWHDRQNSRPPKTNARKIACFSTTNVYGVKDVHPQEAFDEMVPVTFEGRVFPAPKGWHDYLSDLYGDFMKLPPKEKQVSLHNFRAWWKDCRHAD